VHLGELLVLTKIVTRAQLDEALKRQSQGGGRLGDNLVALGALSQEALEAFLARVPHEPDDLQDTGVNSLDLLNLLLKHIYTTRIETVVQFTDALKLPPHLVQELVRMGVARELLVAMGSTGSTMRYTLSEQGRRWAQDALKGSQYIGPAPVSLDAFCERVRLQKISSEQVTFGNIRDALNGYNVTDEFIRKIGPGLNSGRAMLLYGPPGNGKTTVALSFANVFNTVIYMPYAVMIEGQIMRVYDPSLHAPATPEAGSGEFSGGLRREESDARWVPIRRPFVVTGGELTLEMLDLSYDPMAGFYEAPLHLKALGGCFVIDDFGRQIVSPENLLNRWIVPMESRLDYLKLHTGKSFSIPFEALVIFSTNLNPEDLMDAAFLRRLPYKIEVGGPSPENYRAIFEKLTGQLGIEFTDDMFATILHKVTAERQMELAAYHPRFIVDQVVAIARFMGTNPRFDSGSIDYALDNLKVRQPV
jgi:DNA polymerase III delta prime subunit